MVHRNRPASSESDLIAMGEGGFSDLVAGVIVDDWVVSGEQEARYPESTAGFLASERACRLRCLVAAA